MLSTHLYSYTTVDVTQQKFSTRESRLVLRVLQNGSAADLRHRKYWSLWCSGVIKAVRFEDVEFTEVSRGEMSVNLMFIDDAL